MTITDLPRTPGATAVLERPFPLGLPVTARSVLEASGVDLELAMRSAGALDQVWGQLAGAGGSLWSAVNDQLGELARGFLDVDISDVLVGGWLKVRELVEAGEATRGTSECAVVELSGRDLRLVRHPAVDVMLGREQVTTVTFGLAIEARVVALAAIVREGALVGLTSGTLGLTVRFDVQGHELACCHQTFDPSRMIRLGSGVAIPALGLAA